MIDKLISVYRVLALIYHTYNIVPLEQEIPANLLSVDGIEGLVNADKLPRELATMIYKIMLEGGE